jgi:Cobalamin-independent synthase, Catalytic domain
VPPVDALRAKVKSFVDTGILSGHPDRLWVNPDCGLKTCDWPEVGVPSKSDRYASPFACAAVPDTDQSSLLRPRRQPPVLIVLLASNTFFSSSVKQHARSQPAACSI